MSKAPESIYIYTPSIKALLKDGLVWERSKAWQGEVEYRLVGECEWVENAEYLNLYMVQCAHTSTYYDQKFCPNCGNKIKIVEAGQ